MANRKEEKERLRQARLDAEKKESAAQRRRLLLGYGIAGLRAIAVLAGVFIVATSGGGGASGKAHINSVTGSTNAGRRGSPSSETTVLTSVAGGGG